MPRPDHLWQQLGPEGLGLSSALPPAQTSGGSLKLAVPPLPHLQNKVKAKCLERHQKAARKVGKLPAEFPRAAETKYHGRGGFKQQKRILLHVWRLQV